MRNILIVLRHEFLTTIQKRSFWFMTLLFPGLIILMNVGTQLLAANAFSDIEQVAIPVPGGDTAAAGEAAPPAAQSAPHPGLIGLVDAADIIHELPPGVPSALLPRYADEADARAALVAGDIDQVYLIPTDFLETGQLISLSRDFEPFNVPTADLFNFIVAYNLSGDAGRAAALVDPTFSVQSQDLAPRTDADANANSALTFLVPIAVMFVFFFLITMSSGYMLQSVSREKENRTAEVLLVSLRPRELMLGKVLGLSLVAGLQMVIWFGGGLLALEQGQAWLQTAASFTLPNGFLAWGVAFFVLGYLLYASLMGAIGALAPNARESGQLNFVVILPLIIPLWLNFAFVEAPNGTLATALSLIPLTAPVAMTTRMVATSVPLWQVVTSLAGLAVTTYLLVLLAARFFRADTLLSDSAFQWRRLVSEFRR